MEHKSRKIWSWRQKGARAGDFGSTWRNVRGQWGTTSLWWKLLDGFVWIIYLLQLTGNQHNSNNNSNNNNNDNDYNDNDNNNSNKDNSTDYSNQPTPLHKSLDGMQKCSRLRIDWE